MNTLCPKETNVFKTIENGYYKYLDYDNRVSLMKEKRIKYFEAINR